MRLEVKSFWSVDLDRSSAPANAAHCCVPIRADIGAVGAVGADQFDFVVVTPSYLIDHPQNRWGTGWLLVAEFNWLETERMLNRLVSTISAETWSEAAQKLNKFLDWEFDNYQPHAEP